MIKRNLPLRQHLEKKSVLLLGPRRTGKSYLIREEIKPDYTYNLLEADTFRRLASKPETIRKEISTDMPLVAIDEIQKLPSLMDEVHLMIEEKKARFLLTGSSARKLHRNYTSLMAGRAKRLILHPFNSFEMIDYDLAKVLHYGSLPPIYLSENPLDELKDYVGLYLREEILAEALTRKIENFSRFLNIAGLSNGQILNYERVGRDAEVSPRTVREYYSLLEDTLFGTTIYPIKSTTHRKSPSRGKFYFFDIGVVSALINRSRLARNSSEYGLAFEHFIFNEINCFKSYFNQDMKIEFWSDPQLGEVDFILNGETAIEVKATTRVDKSDIQSLKKFVEKGALKRHILISQKPEHEKVGDIELMYYKDFLHHLWSKKIC